MRTHIHHPAPLLAKRLGRPAELSPDPQRGRAATLDEAPSLSDHGGRDELQARVSETERTGAQSRKWWDVRTQSWDLSGT